MDLGSDAAAASSIPPPPPPPVAAAAAGPLPKPVLVLLEPGGANRCGRRMLWNMGVADMPG